MMTFAALIICALVLAQVSAAAAVVIAGMAFALAYRDTRRP